MRMETDAGIANWRGKCKQGATHVLLFRLRFDRNQLPIYHDWLTAARSVVCAKHESVPARFAMHRFFKYNGIFGQWGNVQCLGSLLRTDPFYADQCMLVVVVFRQLISARSMWLQWGSGYTHDVGETGHRERAFERSAAVQAPLAPFAFMDGALCSV